MSNSEKFPSCRLVGEEIDYINEYWDGSFSKFVHSSIKDNIHKIKNNKKKTFFQDFTRNIIMLGIGAIFVLFSLNIEGLLGFIIVLLLGVFFMVTGLVSILSEVKDRWKIL